MALPTCSSVYYVLSMHKPNSSVDISYFFVKAGYQSSYEALRHGHTHPRWQVCRLMSCGGDTLQHGGSISCGGDNIIRGGTMLYLGRQCYTWGDNAICWPVGGQYYMWGDNFMWGAMGMRTILYVVEQYYMWGDNFTCGGQWEWGQYCTWGDSIIYMGAVVYMHGRQLYMTPFTNF